MAAEHGLQRTGTLALTEANHPRATWTAPNRSAKMHERAAGRGQGLIFVGRKGPGTPQKSLIFCGMLIFTGNLGSGSAAAGSCRSLSAEPAASMASGSGRLQSRPPQRSRQDRRWLPVPVLYGNGP